MTFEIFVNIAHMFFFRRLNIALVVGGYILPLFVMGLSTEYLHAHVDLRVV